MRLHIVAVFALIASLEACSRHDPKIVFLKSTASFSSTDIATIERVASDSVREIRALLPALPPALEISVRVGKDVIAETGEAGTILPPAGIYWTVDASRPGGAAAIADRWLRATLFHELHHLTRHAAAAPSSLTDQVVFEGMATAFERDFAGVKVPWGEYPLEVADWAQEILALPPGTSANHWMYSHPDGRRWVGMRVGTYWVDRAMAITSRSAADLVAVPSAEIVRIAQ